MALIIDTNSLSAMADGILELENEISRADEIAIPVIVLGEFRYGVQQSRYRDRYERWLQELTLYCRVLDISGGTAQQYADIRVELKRNGSPIPGNDLWIAALARQYSLPLLSRDRHFDHVSGLIRNEW